ncbi:uncharacterized protein LOC125517443 isoform X2 [Triticum urartu]|uniref:uncharacterized protein LOC125517443 isoform X2 n=1 Tax=Triticum urartu TaxID=4572 RepID=UPI002042E983|nr:uncharacterized protein LOC125517443 isoform X2 [Triticum urartu]
MASANGRAKDGGVTEEQLKAVEYELLRSKTIEQNDKRLAAVRATRASMQEDMEANQAPKKKRKAPSSAPVSANEGRVLRSRVSKDQDHVDPEHQPSKEITHEIDGDGSQKKGGRKITRKSNIYARLNQPKIHIPLNGDGQPVGSDATEFANFIGTLVRKHIPPAELDWRDVDVEKKLLVWETLKAFYELDSTALSFVINTSHIKWKDWKSDLKRYKFDAALTDAQLMKRRDSRISEADWKTLITYWRSSTFEAVKLGHDPRRDEVYIETHTCKKGERKGSYVPQAETTIKELIENAEKHPEWKEKSIQEGDLFARVCGMKEPRGRVRVLGLGPTPQDLGTPGTRGKLSTRVLVEMQGRRKAENRYNMLQGHVQQMEERVNQMELMLASQGRHNLETPSSQHGSNSRQNSGAEAEEHNDAEEDVEQDDEEPFVQRRVVAKHPARSSSTYEDENLIGMDVLLYAWTGPETPVAKATIISVDPDTIVGGETLGPGTYEVPVNVAIGRDATVPYEYDDLQIIADAITRSIAWPSSKMKPYKPGASSSSRR